MKLAKRLMMRQQSSGLLTPAEIVTAFWLDAADASTITLVGSKASQVGDKSGNGRHATQGTDAARLTYVPDGRNGKGVLVGSGGQYMLTPDIFTASSDVSIFIVHRATANDSSGNGVFALQNGLDSTNGFFHALCRTDITNKFRSAFTINSASSGYVIKYPPSEMALNTWYFSGHGRSSAAQFLNWNGSHSESAASGQCAFSSAKGIIGGYYNATQYLWVGEIAEIIVLPTYADATLAGQIYNYCAEKWAL